MEKFKTLAQMFQQKVTLRGQIAQHIEVSY